MGSVKKATPPYVWSRRFSLLCTFLCIVTCGVFVLYTRSSFIDGRAVIEDPASALFKMAYRGSIDAFSLDSEMNSVQNYRTLQEEADVIAHIRFNGNRVSGQYAFVSMVEIERVYKGDLVVGNSIPVIEPLRIERYRAEYAEIPSLFWSQQDIHYIVFADGNYINGFFPLQTGESYLIFMKRIKPTSVNGTLQAQPVYTVLDSPYARIMLSNTEQVALLEHDREVIPMNAIQRKNLVVLTEDMAGLYAENIKAVLADYALPSS